MKLSLLLELLVILIIVAYGAAHPVSKGVKGTIRQEVAAVPVAAIPAPVKPASTDDDDDDVDLLALIGGDDGM